MPGNSLSIFHFETFMTMKITSLTEHYSHQFCTRLIICINSQRTMSCLRSNAVNATVKGIPRRCGYIFGVAMLLCHSIFSNI